nr:hypothetical protein [uncultured bacterium]
MLKSAKVRITSRVISGCGPSSKVRYTAFSPCTCAGPFQMRWEAKAFSKGGV